MLNMALYTDAGSIVRKLPEMPVSPPVPSEDIIKGVVEKLITKYSVSFTNMGSAFLGCTRVVYTQSCWGRYPLEAVDPEKSQSTYLGFYKEFKNPPIVSATYGARGNSLVSTQTSAVNTYGVTTTGFSINVVNSQGALSDKDLPQVSYVAIGDFDPSK